MPKNSFIIYHDYKDILADLTDEQVGKLLRAMFDYEIDQKEPNFTGSLSIAFKFIKKDLDHNLTKYKNICERNTLNGKKGGAPKGNQNARKEEKTTQNNPKQPKTTLYDNDNDNIRKEVVEEKKTTTTTTLKEIFPDLIEDEPLIPFIDFEVLKKSVSESRFLKAFKFMKNSWINKHYSLMAQGYYKDYKFSNEKKGFQSRKYTEEELNGLFDDLDMLDKGENL